MFRVPYRWLPRTFFSNIWSCWQDVVIGVKNIIRWAPVIWHDYDFDWAPLVKVMEYKLRRMSRVFERGHHVGCDKDARTTLVCAALLKRLYDDNYHMTGDPKKWADRAQYDQEYCFKLMSKHLRGWWD